MKSGTASAVPTFFGTPAEFRAWLEAHGAREKELVVGFRKRGTGLPGMTWPESVDEALCFGWIDGIRSRIDDHAYKIRFTPRAASSTWSAINIERARVLQKEGRMTGAGLAAFARRREARSRTYSYEQAQAAALDPKEAARFRRNKAAWKFFESQAPSYRHRAIWQIVSARQAATRERRLARLIDVSREGKRL